MRFEDSIFGDSYLCILMQYCSGGDLSQLLMRQRTTSCRLPEPDIRAMLWQLTSALAHMHAQRVVHRDIKSPTILITADPAATVRDPRTTRETRARGRGEGGAVLAPAGR